MEKILKENIISLDKLMAKNLPPIEWLIDGLIPEEAITILSGMSGSFKTWLAMSMTLSIANGEDFLDIFTTKQTGVLIIDEESGERLYSERFKLLTDSDDVPIYLISMGGFIVNEKNIKPVIEFCKEKGIRLVVIDSMTRVHTGDENTARDTAKFFAILREFTKESISVFIIHHNRKPGQGGYDASSDMRGSSDIRAAVDIQLAVRRIGSSQSIEIRQPKCRYGKEGEPFKLDFCEDEDTGKVRFVYAGSVKEKSAKDNDKKQQVQIRSAIIRAINDYPNAGKGAIATSVAHEINVSTSKVKTEISNMINIGILTATTGKHNTTLLSLSEDYNDMEVDS